MAEAGAATLPRSPELAADAHQYDGRVRFPATCGTPATSVRRTARGGVRLQTIAIVGMSLAGLRAAETLRRDGFDGRIVAIGGRAAPAVRPAAAVEGTARGRVRARRDRAAQAGRRRPRPRLAARARARPRSTSPPARSSSTTVSGRVRRPRHRDRLGAAPPAEAARPRRRVHAAHARRRARAPRPARRSGPKVVVIGAGFIGAEVAATCRSAASTSRCSRALPHPMVRGLGPELGDVIAAVHRDHGVDLRTSTSRRRASTATGSVERVRLGDGSTLDADRRGRRRRRDARRRAGSKAAGLTLDNGVVCDETVLAAPGVVAAGDVARWPNPLFDGAGRCGSSTGRTRPSRVCTRRSVCSPATGYAVRAGAVRLVRPVRPQDPDRRHGRRPTRTCTSRTARSTTGSSSRCSAATAGSSARSGSTGRARSCSTAS